MAYLKCLKANGENNGVCRVESKAYLGCRMDKCVSTTTFPMICRWSAPDGDAVHPLVPGPQRSGGIMLCHPATAAGYCVMQAQTGRCCRHWC